MFPLDSWLLQIPPAKILLLIVNVSSLNRCKLFTDLPYLYCKEFSTKILMINENEVKVRWTFFFFSTRQDFGVLTTSTGPFLIGLGLNPLSFLPRL